YAQYSQFGLWNEMAALFAADAELVYGADRAEGQEAVGQYFLESFGKGRQGLAPGAVHTQMLMLPVVNLVADGLTAKARWSEVSMRGRMGGEATWDGGVHENDYVNEGGVWKIARLQYYPLFHGTYETGWFNTDPNDMKLVPYHFTARE